MDRKRALAALTLLALPAILTCGTARETASSRGPLRPTLSSIQAGIFDRSCVRAGCHLGAASESRLSLRAGESRRGLVNVPSVEIGEMMRVVPGDPDRSYLILKLEGGRIVGERMPMGPHPLSPEAITVLREWIARGAPDD